MSLPVDLERIAHRLGIVLIPYDFPPSISGMAYVGRRKFVLYNQNHPLPRRRFTIAHEIYHIEKHMHDGKTSLNKGNIEKEANAGAARILLPYRDLKAHLKDPRWLYDLSALARKAIVSPITLVRRVHEIKFASISLFELKLRENVLCVRRLVGEPFSMPGWTALLEGARGREFFLKKNELLYRFSNYGRAHLLYVYPL
ncbi:MAG: ImmA/IrrE family metallo-endopeptidase [Synergistetes bacterium]|nr:ImmA/IrrE family metallo-endopeptidase [Synergistota bacterium]